MASALINVPKKARRGDIIEIKTLMSHIMETGYRHTASGQVVPRDIITSFTCRYNGEEIFRADMFPAIAANPFVSFHTVATESGTMDFEWTGDNGFHETGSAKITSGACARSLSATFTRFERRQQKQPSVTSPNRRPWRPAKRVSTNSVP